MICKKLLLSAGACILFSTGFAQLEEQELNPVTVTASLNPITTSKTGRNILVIKGDLFQQLPVNSIDEFCVTCLVLKCRHADPWVRKAIL